MFESLRLAQGYSMATKKGIEPDQSMQDVLAAWRILFEKNHFKEIKRLKGFEERVFGLEVEHSLICKNAVLSPEFHTRTKWTLEIGNMVLNEKMVIHGNDSRLVIRVVNFSENHHFSLDDIRMRHRSSLFTFDVIINPIGGPIGWIKKAVYECEDCETRFEIKQRLAREREAPNLCMNCIEIYMAKNKGKWPRIPPVNFKMIVEDCYYEDIEYLNALEVSFDSDGNLLKLGGGKFHGVVNDEYVGNLIPGSIHRINAKIAVDHLPNRNFIKDTRRIILLKIHSIEESPFNFSNVSETSIVLEDEE